MFVDSFSFLMEFLIGTPGGTPDPPPRLRPAQQFDGYDVPDGFAIKKRSIIGGLHREYRLERIVA
jgi:hypothetical protein